MPSACERQFRKKGLNVRIEHENNSNYCASWDHIGPESDDDIASHNLKGHKSCFEHEKVPASSESECVIHESTGKSDEWRGYREESDHLGDA
jgi:hypothetical protein